MCTIDIVYWAILKEVKRKNINLMRINLQP